MGHGEHLHLMAIYVNSAGKPIINSSGAPIDCPTCPCSSGVTCCFTAPVPTCLEIVFSGVTNGTCTACASFNSTYELIYGSYGPSACQWRSDGPQSIDCGTPATIRVDLYILNLGNCAVIVEFSLSAMIHARYTGSFAPGSLSFPWTLAKNAPGSSTLCTWPATIDVNGC